MTSMRMPYHPYLRSNNKEYGLLEKGSRVKCKAMFRGEDFTLTGYIVDQRIFYKDIAYLVEVNGKIFYTKSSWIKDVLI